MIRPLSVLLLAETPDLVAEWRDATAPLVEPRPLVHTAPNAARLVAEARNRAPDLVVVPLPQGHDQLHRLAQELRAAAPNAALLGCVDRSAFASGDAEADHLLVALRLGFADVLRRPLSRDELTASLARIVPGRTPAPAASAKGLVTSFVSNKGGVGKTTLAVNLACELAQRAPHRVLLVDAALQLGLCAAMLDIVPHATLTDVVGQLDRLDATLLRQFTVEHESGLHLLAGPPDAVAAARVDEQHLARVLGVARETFDHVVVDTFPILDAIALAVLDRSDLVFQVVAPTVPAVLGATQLLKVLEQVGVETARQRLIVNGAIPPHAGALQPRDVADRLGRAVDLVVPFSRAAVTACNTGRPVVRSIARWRSFRRSLRSLADLVVAERAPAEQSSAVGGAA